MKNIRLLVSLIAATSLLSGCSSQQSENMPHEESNNQERVNSSNNFWQRFGYSSSSTEETRPLSSDYTDKLTEAGGLFVYVSSICAENHMPMQTAFIPLIVSNYDPLYQDDTHSGLWGLNDAQAAALGLPNDYWLAGKNDIVLSTQATVSYLKYLHSILNKDWDLAYTAYRHGVTPILNAVHQNQSLGQSIKLEALPLDESMKLFANELNQVSSTLIAQSSHHPHGELSHTDTIHVIDTPSQYDMQQMAELIKVDYHQLKQLNAGNKRPLSPPNGPFRVIVPASHVNYASKVLKDPTIVSQAAKKTWIRHKVNQGESLSIIAQNYMTNIDDLRRVNHIKGDQIKINQLILIPPVDKTDVRTQPSATPGPQRIIHTVKNSDTLYSIAKNYSQKISDVMYWNNMKEKNVRPGQKITVWKNGNIESPYLYTVKADDSLSKIARAHQTSVEQLKKINQLNSNVIHPNTTLIIPYRK
ncbi:LysM peptidoglycan-binding domain-containing protein [Gammaproteobacteria bacterium]|nr:LysM peptidoglycan-binding domain-containing protein [Gammaproteobacteria bacterium]